MKEYGNRLAKLLKTLNFKQTPFAKAIGVSQTFFNKVINGKADLSRDMMEKILERFPNVNLSWLLTGKGQMFYDLSGELNMVQDGGIQYGKRESVKIHPVGDESHLKNLMVANLKTTAKHWDMFNNELFALLDPTVGRQAVSKYMLGQVIPRLPSLVRFELITGIRLTELLTREIKAEELPPAPLTPGDALQAIRAELQHAERCIRVYLAGEKK